MFTRSCVHGSGTEELIGRCLVLNMLENMPDVIGVLLKLSHLEQCFLTCVVCGLFVVCKRAEEGV